MRHREFKNRLYADLGRVARAVGSARRLELVDLLAQGERSVEDLARESALSFPNASRHLQVLRKARLVEKRKVGLRVYYRLAEPQVFDVSRAIRALAERRPGDLGRLVREHLGRRDPLEALPRHELVKRMREGRVVVVDVRPSGEFRAGHIPGARSIPVDELDARLAELPRRKEIVAYCRGPYCVMAFDAVSRLRAHGWRARRLVEGLPEWRAAGLPVEASAA